MSAVPLQLFSDPEILACVTSPSKASWMVQFSTCAAAVRRRSVGSVGASLRRNHGAATRRGSRADCGHAMFQASL